MGVDLSGESLDFLLAEAGRHPDLLKTACEYYMSACRESAAPGCYEIARAEFRLDEHVDWLCRALWRRRSAEGQTALAALAAGQTYISDPILAARLVRRTGLVVDAAGRLQIFSAVFRDWILRETAVAPQMPQSLIDHQPAQRLVLIEGREIRLTSLENRLLGYLLDHANEVCTTGMLLENVWGGGKKTAVVEKGVNRLRAKIEKDPRRPRFILSARGEGYILRAEGG
jgi:DNA-binding response OmpR family regulator